MDSFTNKSPDFGDEFKSEENKNQQAQIAIEQDVNLVQLKEREASLRRLENDIVDVNMIFKDLAVMVHDQGEVIDSIESNVENVQIRVTEANSSLESAKKNQVTSSFSFILNILIHFFEINSKQQEKRNLYSS